MHMNWKLRCRPVGSPPATTCSLVSTRSAPTSQPCRDRFRRPQPRRSHTQEAAEAGIEQRRVVEARAHIHGLLGTEGGADAGDSGLEVDHRLALSEAATRNAVSSRRREAHALATSTT
jgi:hypothetical protein